MQNEDLKLFIKTINNLRLKGSWYQYVGMVDGKDIKIKGYGTWLQIFKVNGIDHSNCMGQSIKQFKDALLKAF